MAKDPLAVYVDALSVALGKTGGRCLMSDLGEKVPKPPGVKGKFKVVLDTHSDKFALEKLGKGSQYCVHAIQKRVHKFDDPSLKRMFRALYAMSTYYQRRSWPIERPQWEVDLSKEMGMSGSGGILFAMCCGKYVAALQKKILKWNIARIYDAVNQMPDSLKSLPASSDSEQGLVSPSGTPSTTTSMGTFESKQKGAAQCDHAWSSNKTWKLIDGTGCILIDDEASLETSIRKDSFLQATGSDRCFVAVDCEGVPDSLELVQIATPSKVYIFDCKTIGEAKVCHALAPLFSSESHIKLMHDLHKDAAALETYGHITLRGVLDTQLVAEHVWGEMFLGFNGLLRKLELPVHPSKEFVHSRMRGGEDIWHKRPIPRNHLEYAAMDASLLLAAAPAISEILTEIEMPALLKASELRASNASANDGMRSICFDISNDYKLASADLLKITRPAEGFFGESLVVESEIEEVVALLPPNLRTKLSCEKAKDAPFVLRLFGKSSSEEEEEDKSESAGLLPLEDISDVTLDIGRRPQCWIEDKRVFLCDDESQVVAAADVQHVSSRLGEFGSDNRAGLDSKLHRFSAMRNRKGAISGITIRIGRSVRGNAAMLMDFLIGSDKSILILGEPGSGKTTIVREAIRKLAQEKNVVVVDTSNEIAGDGTVPHGCIGLARRMMVPTLDQQGAVMVECVQNHTPHVMVIDEIGRPREVQAARTVKQRGVRMIASAHGDLRKLLKNKDLSGLLGGIEHVIVGDEMAREDAKRKERLAFTQDGEKRSFEVSKTKCQRGGEPTFEIIVEVRRGAHHEWRLVADSARAVDDILDGLRYKAHLRTRDPETGEMRMEFVSG
jgi:stage III sporulation protein SpoIIIAA